MNENETQAEKSWYEPAPVRTEKPVESKKKKRGWIYPLIALLIVGTIVGLSLIFRDTSPKAAPVPSDDSDSVEDFFKKVYAATERETLNVNIPRLEEKLSFSLELEPRGGEKLTAEELYARCSLSVVAVTASKGGKPYSWGSGVILSADGLILTNTHVINNCDGATVLLTDGRELEAKLVGADMITDLAVLKIEARDLPAARFGDSAEAVVGEEVFAIGNPLGESYRLSITNGILSGIDRDVNYNNRTMTLLQTNAALNSGNSGGPLFNAYGQVIGVTNMKIVAPAEGVEGIGFAIPSGTAETVVRALLTDGKVVGRPAIGITVGPIPDSESGKEGMPEGLYISEVATGSDAKAKGLKKGDILVAVNGEAMTELDRLKEIKDACAVGDELLFTVWRDGETFEVAVRIVDVNDVYG